jgi:uncharacterized metal-binding protein YceD (DUF177 family)
LSLGKFSLILGGYIHISMLEFKINEIPKGTSESTVYFTQDELGVETGEFRDLSAKITFDRREALISVNFVVSGETLLTCDRSLKEFWTSVSGEYTVLFKESADFESEDDQTAVRRLDVSGNIINISAEIRDTVVLAIPVRRIHHSYYDENGELKEFEHETSVSEGTDPRWDALRALKDNTSNN